MAKAFICDGCGDIQDGEPTRKWKLGEGVELIIRGESAAGVGPWGYTTAHVIIPDWCDECVERKIAEALGGND